MTLFRTLWERRAIDASQFPFAHFQGAESHAGVSVDKDSALNYIPVWSCIRLLSESIAMLPVHVFRQRDEVREKVARQPKWLEQPNPETHKFDFWERQMSSLNTNGNAYTLVTALDDLGFPAEVWNLHPDNMTIERRRGALAYRYRNDEGIEDTYPRWNAGRPRTGAVLHIKAFSNGGDYGLNPIDAARQGIGLGLVTEQFGSRFFGQGQNPSGVIEVPDKASVGEDFKDRIKESWMAKQGGPLRSHLPAVLTGGAQWKPVSIPPDTAQFLETRKFQRSEIAMFFRVPPHMISDVEKTTSWGTGIEQQGIGFVTYSLMSWTTRLEAGFNQLTPRGQYVKWNMNALLRGDAKSRGAFYALMLDRRVMVPNEVRALEDMNPIEGGDVPIEPQGAPAAPDMGDDEENEDE